MRTIDDFTSPTGRVIGAEHYLTDGYRAVLRVTHCRACDRRWFPARAQCSHCASWEVDDAVTSSSGTAYASTVVRVGPTRFGPPYPLAYVDIDGVRLLAHVAAADALPPGTPVELRHAPIAADEQGALLSYAVAAAKGDRS
ncbi:Zn-ribbon domain-containing OB-fold protein [Mycolicibacterium smegmatis]|uniref:Zn-ribbon domain-containing OB-fold protein n=1 Tax=Mycolicibacterium smegmatis TaxID=1772 RepID=UPI001303C301|nr:OB-fold domain-containing protein [Mycolicibacterium smegmatis]